MLSYFLSEVFFWKQKQIKIISLVKHRYKGSNANYLQSLDINLLSHESKRSAVQESIKEIKWSNVANNYACFANDPFYDVEGSIDWVAITGLDQVTHKKPCCVISILVSQASVDMSVASINY